MKVTDLKFARRYAVADYEYAEYTVSAVLDEEGDVTPAEALQTLKAEVEAAHKGAASSPAKASPKKEEPKKMDSPKKAKPQSPGADDEEEVDDVGESEDDADDEVVDQEEEEKKPASKKPSKSSDAGPKKSGFKKKGSVYDRENELHKKLFSEKAKELVPGWNKSEAGKAKGKKLSQQLAGTEFLDENGEIVESFEKAMKKGLR
jgi:hypothetical protein